MAPLFTFGKGQRSGWIGSAFCEEKKKKKKNQSESCFLAFWILIIELVNLILRSEKIFYDSSISQKKS
jgi:hypothetical protein